MILAAGLTPAWQRTLVFDAFRPGEVNRAREVRECASGKVLNVARALHRLGAETEAVTLAGGIPGAALRKDIEAAGLKAHWIESASPTRTCTTILADGRMTELVENAGEISRDELDAFIDAYGRKALKEAKTVVVTGSLPRGTPSWLYRHLLEKHPPRMVLDARGPELLEALDRRPFVVKPNRSELGDTLGRDLSDERALLAAMAEIKERGAQWVVVTDGAGPVRVLGEGSVRTLRPPKAKPVNPIGCGDCLAAGIALTIAKGGDVLEGVRTGMAAATDNLTRLLPARLDPARVARLTQDVKEI